MALNVRRISRGNEHGGRRIAEPITAIMEIRGNEGRKALSRHHTRPTALLSLKARRQMQILRLATLDQLAIKLAVYGDAERVGHQIVLLP